MARGSGDVASGVRKRSFLVVAVTGGHRGLATVSRAGGAVRRRAARGPAATAGRITERGEGQDWGYLGPLEDRNT